MAARLPETVRRVLKAASRLGYAARGFVYLCVATIAFLAALDLAPKPSGATDAMALWARWTAGLVLISALAVGLAGFSAWRFVQALFDADHHGASPKGLAVRLGQAVSGVIYGVLAFSMLELLDGLEDIGEADETDSARTLAAEVLALPHGDWIMLAAGLGLFGVGIGNVVQGLMQDFAKRLNCSPRMCRWSVPLARAGYVGRGLATLPLGLYLFRAGLDVRASEARSWADALQSLEGQPFGHFILALVAGGLAAFGLFGLFEAIYRRIEAPRRLEPA